MASMNRIELNPKVCNGRPVIKGTRIPVSVILEQIAEGDSWDAVLSGRLGDVHQYISCWVNWEGGVLGTSI